MKSRKLAAGLTIVALGLTGCADGNRSGAQGHPMAAMSMGPGQTMTGMSMAGMSMAPGQTVAGKAADQPSEAARMVCSADIQSQVKRVLKLDKLARADARWQDQRYFCTYTLPMGQLVLSVQQSETKAAARGYFDARRRLLGKTEPLAGLGESSYATMTGIAVVLKDSLTLQVDASGLPAVFGPQLQRRTDLAYELASDVLGCWTGDE